MNVKIYKIRECENWRSFIALMTNKPPDNNLVWRGQGNSLWHLTASMARPPSNIGAINLYYEDLLPKIPGIQNYDVRRMFAPKLYRQVQGLDAYAKQLSRYEDEYSECFGSNLDLSSSVPHELTNWAWAQHYNMATPLLDWTHCMMYALFFACESYKSNKTKQISVFSLNIASLTLINPFLQHTTYQKTEDVHSSRSGGIGQSSKFGIIEKMLPMAEDYLSGDRDKNFIYVLGDMAKLKIIMPCNENSPNQRIACQRGLFTFVPYGMSLETWCNNLQKTVDETESYLPIQHPLITRYNINLTPTQRKECLKFLESANINATTIYPDFQGKAKHMEYLRRCYPKVHL